MNGGEAYGTLWFRSDKVQKATLINIYSALFHSYFTALFLFGIVHFFLHHHRTCRLEIKGVLAYEDIPRA